MRDQSVLRVKLSLSPHVRMWYTQFESHEKEIKAWQKKNIPLLFCVQVVVTIQPPAPFVFTTNQALLLYYVT